MTAGSRTGEACGKPAVHEGFCKICLLKKSVAVTLKTPVPAGLSPWLDSSSDDEPASFPQLPAERPTPPPEIRYLACMMALGPTPFRRLPNLEVVDGPLELYPEAYRAALDELIPKQFPGLKEYRDWFNRMPPISAPQLAGFDEYLAWRNSMPPLHLSGKS